MFHQFFLLASMPGTTGTHHPTWSMPWNGESKVGHRPIDHFLSTLACIYIEYYIVFEYVLIWKTAYMLQMFEPCPLHGWKSAQFRDISTRNLNERPWKYRTTVPISQPLWNDHGLSMSKLKWNLRFPAIVKPDPLLWRISHLVVSNGTC